MKQGIALASWFACALVAAAAQGDELADAPSTHGQVRVHIRSRGEEPPAHVYVRSEEHGARLLCTTPCTTHVAQGDQLHVTYGADEDDKGTDLTVLAADGEDLDVEVTQRPIAPVVGSIAMITAGALAILGGIVLAGRQLRSGSESPGAFVPAVLIGTGAAVGIGGLIWLRHQSKGPHLDATPLRSADRAPSAMRRAPWMLTWQLEF